MEALGHGGSAKECERCRAPWSAISCRRCPISRIERSGLELRELDGARSSAIYLDGGKLRLEGEIGRGGMGTVFVAVDEALERIVAVKFLRPELQAAQNMADRFRREAKATASIAHKNVITIYSSGRFGGSDYFVAEYIDGSSLERFIDVSRSRREPIPLHCALWILDQACAGLAAVHAGGVVHRDVKPGNVMIEANTGRVVIMDFGIGGLVGSAEDAGQGGSLGGTPSYMAPEAFTDGYGDEPGEPASDGRLSDIYSLGVTAFEALTGELPFTGKSLMELMFKHMDETPPRPSSLRRDLPRAVDEIILRCLAKDPADRFRSFDEVREALRPFLAPALALEAPEEALAQSVTSAVRALLEEDASEPHVVVADPDPGFVVVVQEALRRQSPRGVVQAARSFRKALDIARRRAPTVLIVPLDGAEDAGVDAAKLIERNGKLSSTRVIFTTSLITSEARRRIEARGGATVMLKPASSADMDVALDWALARGEQPLS